MFKSAPKKLKHRINLNLLNPQGVPEKIPLKFLKWLISYGRYIVVVVEIVVLACFAVRFKLDADLADLKESINSQVPYLESLTVDEALIIQTQQRLINIQKVVEASSVWDKTFVQLASQTPPGVKVTAINLDKSNPALNKIDIRLSGKTPSNNDVALFLSGLKQDPFFADINLASISFDQGVILFSITGSTR